MSKANKSKKQNTNEVVWLIIGLLLTWMGCNSIFKNVNTPFGQRGTDLYFSLGMVIFGSMILGVAINKLYQGQKKSKDDKS